MTMTPLTGERGVPKFALGMVFKTSRTGDRHPKVCTVVDILRTYNAAGDLVRIRYVSEHIFTVNGVGQAIYDYDVLETTIARGLVSEAEPAPP